MGRYREIGTNLRAKEIQNLNHNFSQVEADLNNISGAVLDKVIEEAQLNWREPVNSFSNLATSYPSPQIGWASMARDDGKVYRYNGTSWVEIQQIDAGPVNELDTRLTAELAETNEQKANRSDVNDLLTLKRDKTVKIEPEDLSPTTLGIVTGTGGPINLLSIPQNDSVTPDSTTFFTKETMTVSKIQGLAFTNAVLINTSVANAVTYKINIKPNQIIKIKATNNDRLRLGILNKTSLYNYETTTGNPNQNLDKLIDLDASLTAEYTFENDELGKELYVYVKFHGSGSAGVPLVSMTAKNQIVEVTQGKKLVASDLDRPIERKDLSPKVVSPNELDFFDKEVKSKTNLNGDIFDNGDGTYQLRINPAATGFVLYKIELNAKEFVKINTQGNNRFRLIVMNSINHPNNVKVDKVIVANDSLKEFEFYNDENGKLLYLYINNGSGVNVYPETTFEVFNSPLLTTSEKPLKKEYELEIKAITNNLRGAISTKQEYPVMFGVKTSNQRINKKPEVLGWLYYEPYEPYRLLYADGNPENMKVIANWDKSKTWNGIATPENYSPFITKDGDIIFVFRGEQFGNGSLNSNARQNPIIYPANDYSNPVVVDFGDNIKPTNWLQNSGVDYIYNQDCFIFSEYTRTVHDKCYVWKVTKPFTNPANWRRVQEQTLSGSATTGMKHYHTSNYDPYSGEIYITTGDDDSAAQIFKSSDYGETWELVLGPSEKYCRLLNFVFTEDRVYWASDSFAVGYHWLFSVDRVDGIPDFSNVTELSLLPSTQATYTTALIDEKGLLILDRRDNPSVNPMNVYFWDFENASLQVVTTMYPLNEVSANTGFRCEAVNWYQALNDERIVCGFGYYANQNEILGNETADRVHNLTLKLKEKVVQE